MSNPSIEHILAREVLDSRGNPTIQVEVISKTGEIGRVTVPSGASTGSHEAYELRDGDMERYHGKGVLKAVSNVVNLIAPQLMGFDCRKQQTVDYAMIELDGTNNKKNLGANAILGVSLATARCAASCENMSVFQYLGEMFGYGDFYLPVPQINILNGGAHANNNIDFQEFMVLPVGAPDFPEAVRCGAEIFHTLKKVLQSKGYSTNVGDEGGFAPDCKSNREAVELILEAIEATPFALGADVLLGLDVASSHFYRDGLYHLAGEGVSLDSSQFADFLEDWVNDYPIFSIEDGMAENDWHGWTYLTSILGKSVQLVGDDLFVTDKNFIKYGAEIGAANAVLIKPNQIGTLTETFDAIAEAISCDFNTVISHRSGDTEDTMIVDIAVATGATQIKTGSMSRSERIAKYNYLLMIHDMLWASGEKVSYLGHAIFNNLDS